MPLTTPLSPKQPTALIAGAGVAGLAAAILLDELGYHVTLVEKKIILGGRTYSFQDKKTGLTIDNGQHLLIGAYHETLSLLEKIGAKHKIHYQIPTSVPLYNGDGNRSLFELNHWQPPLNLLRAFVNYSGMKWKDKRALVKLGITLNKIKSGKMSYPENLTVTEWLKGLGQSDTALKNFWEILTLATLNDTPDVASAAGLVTVMLKSYFAGKQDGFLILPTTGLSELFCDPAERYLFLRGHHITRGVGLKEIRVLQNKVQSFRFDDGSEMKADLYVSALPFRNLWPTLPEPFALAHDELKNIPKLTSSPIISINLFFDRAVFHDAFIGASGTNVHWYFARNHFLKTSASEIQNPQNLHHVMGVISGAYDFLEMSREEIVQMALRDLQKLFPKSPEANLVHSLVNKEREATLSCKPGITALRPKQKILDNFSIIGDWTQTGLPGTIESAALSARLMAKSLQSSTTAHKSVQN